MNKPDYELDAYEQEILDAFESSTLKPVPLDKEERERFRQMATETLAKTRRVNIRMTSMTLEGMQAKAAEEGLPYQTLMASVLHKYASGRLVDSLSLAARPARRRAVAI
jgi:predicted DNA binding CopG/RHH family protein